jgi:signal transduction histidine kinase
LGPLRSVRSVVVDTCIAVGLAVLAVAGPLLGPRSVFGEVAPVAILLLLLQTLPLIARRRAPLAVFAITLTATLAHAAFGAPGQAESFGSLLALYTVASLRDRRTAIAATIATIVTIVIAVSLREAPTANLPAVAQNTIAIVVAAILGDATRARRLYARALEERSAILLSEREERARLAVSEERERIARELHDVVAHHLSVVVIQAGAGLRAFERRPEKAREALTAIDSTARQALGEMRRMLGFLSVDAGGRNLAPMPGLAQLESLVEQVRSAGLPVELSMEGPARALDPGVDLSAYRIIQEALTNTLRHAGDARARVSITYEPSALRLEVVDDGRNGTGAHPVRAIETKHDGRGLIGMRERVALFGGELEVGPQATGGYRVRARIPITHEPSA